MFKFVIMDNTTNNGRCYLPAASTAGAGAWVTVKRIGTGSCAIAPIATDRIDALAVGGNRSINQWIAYTLVSNGIANWYLI
jgi:hypothetical protein